MDIYEAGRQKAQRERESAGRMKAAAKSPLASSGGGGFQRADKPKADETPTGPGGKFSNEDYQYYNMHGKKVDVRNTATEMGGAQDKGEPAVAYGQDSLNYLGHMAGNDVAAEGHNIVPLTGQQGFGMIGSMSPTRYMGHFAGNDVTREGHNTVPKSAVSKKISHLMHEGKPQAQSVAMALNMKREGRLTKEGGYKRVKKDK